MRSGLTTTGVVGTHGVRPLSGWIQFDGRTAVRPYSRTGKDEQAAYPKERAQ